MLRNSARTDIGWIYRNTLSARQQHIVQSVALSIRKISKLFGFKIWKSGVYFFREIPNTVDKNWAVIIVAAGIVMAILGALVPALRASRVQPVEALRYE